MELRIVGKNMDISQEICSYVEDKVARLDRHLPNIDHGLVEITQEVVKSSLNKYVVQLTLVHSGAVLRGEERSSDIHAAINSAVDVVDRRIERYKGKLYEKGKKRTSSLVADSEPGEKRIVREKRFVVEKMSSIQAAERMEMLGHDFFLFLSEEDGRFSLLYRRQDDDYGLIEAEVG